MNILLADKRDAKDIAIIHKARIEKGFLSSLPNFFLERLYKTIIVSNAGFCIVAKENNKVVGFISSTTNIKKIYKDFFRRYFFSAALVFFMKIVNISALKKIFENLLYPVKERALPQAELLTMAVTTEYSGKGVASKMFLEFVEKMKKKNVTVFKVLVGEELKQAIHFYEKSGFSFLKNTVMHKGSSSRIYIYTINY